MHADSEQVQGCPQGFTRSKSHQLKTAQKLILFQITKRFHEEVHEDDKTKLIIRVPAFGDEKKLGTVTIIMVIALIYNAERDTGLVDAMDELKLTVVNLGTLSEGINRFSQWWVEMETELKNAGAKGSGLRPGKDKGRVKQLRGIWSGFKEDYFQYKTRVCDISLSKKMAKLHPICRSFGYKIIIHHRFRRQHGDNHEHLLYS